VTYLPLIQHAVNPLTLTVKDLPNLDKLRVILYEFDSTGSRSIMELWEYDVPNRYYKAKLVKKIRSDLADFAGDDRFKVVLERVPA